MPFERVDKDIDMFRDVFVETLDKRASVLSANKG